MITSTHNERVKYVRSLVRRRVRDRDGCFVVEGTRLVEEMVRAGVRPALAFCTETWAATRPAEPLLPSLERAEAGLWRVTEAVLAACAQTETPQGVLTVAPYVTIPARPGLILILDALRDPGNLGTVLRSAEAAGVGQVVVTPGTVDLYNPKAIRGAMGAHFRLPVVRPDFSEIRDLVAGRAVWLADAGGSTVYDAVDWLAPSALIVGGEAAGTGEAAASLATGRVSIPMAAGTESLNAAVAAAVILFEAARQRRGSSL